MNKVIITDMYWHNIYLTLSLQGDAIKDCHFYVTDLKKVYPLEQPVDNKLTINMVNINETKLLDNGKWYFYYEKDHEKLLSQYHSGMWI